MTRKFLDNYDAHVRMLVRFLDTRVDAHLLYDGSRNLHDHIADRTVYACSIRWRKNGKILRNVFPVMLGSRLDEAIRHGTFAEGTTIPEVEDGRDRPFEEADIGRGYFVVNGFLRQVPYFYTNDPTTTHVAPGGESVRVFVYDAENRGKKLSYHVADHGDRRSGDLVVLHNNGSESTEDVDRFFDHCPYPTDEAPYMARIFRGDDDQFEIDHLGNKTVVSPGHLFVRLVVKYLYGPMRAGDWPQVKSKTKLVAKSIETGRLLHVLSRKTNYFKEGKSAGKMVNVPDTSHREIGDNGQIFVEKNMGCYREVGTQTYPLNPYLLSLVVRQISNKVKNSKVPAIHESHVGFLCIVGLFESKNVGRTTMMVRDTVVSTVDALDPVFGDARNADFWKSALPPLESPGPADRPYFVVVNEACVPVTRSCFLNIDLLRLKRELTYVECFERGRFVHVRYKTGIIFNRLPGTDVWVTPRDDLYWAKRLLGIDDKTDLFDRGGYDYVTSPIVDINPFWTHNAFSYDILAFNALKNAVLATTDRFARYFMDTVSAYLPRPSRYHEPVLDPVPDDGISSHFALMLPRVTVAYMSFGGYTQEDCIARRTDVDAFDCCRFYTLRFKMETLIPSAAAAAREEGWIVFHPVRKSNEGDPADDVDDHDTLIGSLTSERPMRVESFSIHGRAQMVSDRRYDLHFTKLPFRILGHAVGKGTLTVCVEQPHASSTGDKLCSLHGQKGVVRVVDRTPCMEDRVHPDLIVNCYGLFRSTVGQIVEGLVLGGGRDAEFVRDVDGNRIPDSEAFYAKTFYFPIAYWASEHLYAPRRCVKDKILAQAVKGRSRKGGMRLGNMELNNALRGNGIAACFEAKFFEDGDRVVVDGALAMPKSVNLVCADAKFFKCNLEYETRASVVETTDDVPDES